MSTMVDTPVPGLAPELSVQPAAGPSAAAVVLPPYVGKWTRRRVKDILVAIYAYGLLAFGLLFPLVLAAWAAIFKPGVQ